MAEHPGKDWRIGTKPHRPRAVVAARPASRAVDQTSRLHFGAGAPLVVWRPSKQRLLSNDGGPRALRRTITHMCYDPLVGCGLGRRSATPFPALSPSATEPQAPQKHVGGVCWCGVLVGALPNNEYEGRHYASFGCRGFQVVARRPTEALPIHPSCSPRDTPAPSCVQRCCPNGAFEV